MEYTVNLEQWKSDSLLFKINFEEPLQLSGGEDKDELEISVRDSRLFAQ